MLNVKVVVGSTREGRFSELVLPWLHETAAAHEALSLEVLDLRDYDMPFFDKPVSPAYVQGGDYGNETVNRFGAKIAEADAVIFITPEYNRSYSAVLKNALDSVYLEWNNKPMAIVTYGSVGGARAAEQLRLVAIELQMAPIRNGVHIMAPWMLRNEDGSLKAGSLESYTDSLNGALTQLTWWAQALKAARTTS